MGLLSSVTRASYAGSICRRKSERRTCLVLLVATKASMVATWSALTPTTWALAASKAGRFASKPLISSVQVLVNAWMKV
jgi:hypothetical protein